MGNREEIIESDSERHILFERNTGRFHKRRTSVKINYLGKKKEMNQRKQNRTEKQKSLKFENSFG